MKSNPAWHEELIDLFKLAASDRNLLDALLDDLCTPAELSAMARRWQIIKDLQRDISQRDIADRTGVAIATVTRGSRMLKKPTGGFARLIHMILTTKRPNGPVKAWRSHVIRQKKTQPVE